MKINKVKKAAILATVLGGVVFGSNAEAAKIAAVAVGSYGAETQIGTVEGSFVTSEIKGINPGEVTDLSGDVAIYNIFADNESSLYIRQTENMGTAVYDGITFNTQLKDWSDKSNIIRGTISDGNNAHGVARKGNFIYIANYNTPGLLAVGEVNGKIIDDRQDLTVDLKDSLNEYITLVRGEEGLPDNTELHGESVYVDGENIYVLANRNIDCEWEGDVAYYGNSYLIQYQADEEGHLYIVGYAEMGKNTDRPTINKYNNYFLATNIGGYQNFGEANEETSLYVAEVNKTTGNLEGYGLINRPIVVPDNVLEDYSEFRDIKILPNGTAYVLRYNQGTATGAYVYKTTISNLLSNNPESWELVHGDMASYGYFNAIDAEYYTKRVWVQDGSTIYVYVDGEDVASQTFQINEFSNNGEFWNINGFLAIKPDMLGGNIAKLRDDVTKKENVNSIWANATVTERITSDKNYDNDIVVTLDSSKEGDLSNNIIAAVYAKDNNVTVTAGGNVLQLQVENTVATPVGIYAGNGKNANVTADTINIITKGMNGGNSLNNTIMLDASASGTQAAINISGDVNINMTGGNGGNAITVQKTDRWGESTYAAKDSAIITIDGDVSVKGADNQTWGIEANKENVFSRFNNAGILTSVNKSEVNINGKVDMDVYGNGVTVNAEDSSVTIAEGGQITVPQGTNYGYYALAAYNGTINMNMGADGETVGIDNDVVLNGDLFALNTGIINVALVTENSQLNGTIDSAGETSVYLQNGATWNNVQNNERYVLDYEDQGSGAFDKNGNYNGISHVTNLYGGNSYDNAGVINQDVNSNNLTIDNYSGNTVVTYNHNASKPTEIYGGNVTIKSAEADSAITLRTDSVGIEFANTESVENVLDALANKLYYTGYVTGERNLDGYVEIAEGITSSSVRKEYGHIGYNEKDGQGSFAGNVENLEPDSQTKVSFTAPIFGVEAKDTAYVEDNVLKDGVYEFVKEETTITVANNTITGGPWVNSGVGAAISAVGEGNKTIINLNKNKLNVNTTHSSNHSTGISAINKGIVEINNPGDISLEAIGGGMTGAVFANGGGEVHIHNGDGGTVIARASASNAANGAVIKTMNGASGIESKIIIDGMVDVVADKNEGANEAISAVASRIEIGGGNIEAKNGAWAAIRAYGEFQSDNSGIVNVNVTKDEDGNVIGAGNRKTTITGDFVTNGGMGSKGQISVGLRGEDSYWHGKYTDNVGYGVTPGQLGSVNLWIEDGAHWTGYSSGSVNVNINGEGSYWDGYSTNSKMLLSLTDGAIWKNSNASKTSLIGNFVGDGGYIENAGGVTIDNYSGNTTVIYKHDAEVPTNIIGGDVTIKSAAEDSEITLRTGNAGINVENTEQVNSVLDSLAHKLYYTAYINNAQDNLKGYVQIAEGLTSSSATKAVGDIEFSAETGQGSLLVSGDTEGGENPDNPNPDNPNPDNPEDDNQGGESGVTKGDYETAMMSGAKSAMVSSAMMWRAEANDIMKRMGDLRMAKGEEGIWAKYSGTKYEMNTTNTKYTNNYKAYQLGYDKKVGNWTVGVAASYGDGESTYSNGRGENSVVSLGLYGAWNGKDGQYVDLIMKRSKLDNEYTLNGNVFIGQIEADYETWATSISAEYGKRFETAKGFYVEPSAELTLGRVEGEDYNTSLSIGGEKLNVQQDDYDTLVGRIGLRLGQKLDKASYYAKFAVAKEFAGDFDTKYATVGNSGVLDTKETSMSFKDTWYEMQIGGTAQLSDNSYIYASYERNFGADVEQKWRIDAGLRFTF